MIFRSSNTNTPGNYYYYYYLNKIITRIGVYYYKTDLNNIHIFECPVESPLNVTIDNEFVLFYQCCDFVVISLSLFINTYNAMSLKHPYKSPPHKINFTVTLLDIPHEPNGIIYLLYNILL